MPRYTPKRPHNNRLAHLLILQAVVGFVVYSFVLPVQTPHSHTAHASDVQHKPLPTLPPRPSSETYVTFEPWNGGWNNRRMSLEIAVVFARLSNRTLVLPPAGDAPLTKGRSAYEDFLNISVLRAVLPKGVLLWTEFASVVETLPIVKPLGKSCAQRYRGATPRSLCTKARSLRERSTLLAWNALNTVLPVSVHGTPAVLNDTVMRRMEEFAGKRVAKMEFSESAVHGRVVHFPQNLFGHFYQLFFPLDEETRQIVLRTVRDGVVFNDVIQSVARKVVAGLNATYSCVHVRRGDFQRFYPMTALGPAALVGNVARQLDPVVYVATDEPDESFWTEFSAVLPKGIHMVRRGDVVEQLAGVDQNAVGFVEMLVCSHAAVFIGTRYSTFSSYITRLRGYSEVRNKEVYTTDVFYQSFRPVQKRDRPYTWKQHTKNPWAREFPEAWEGIGRASPAGR